VQNSPEGLPGQLAGLKDNALMDRKDEKMKRPLRRIQAITKRWPQLLKRHKDLPAYLRERRIFDQGNGFNTATFGIARTLVRLAAENENQTPSDCPSSPNLAALRLSWRSTRRRRFMTISKKLKLADSLGFMVELLGADNPLVKQILNGKSPEVRAGELIDGTKLKDVAFRRELAAGGSKGDRGFNRSDDRPGAA